VRTVFVQRVRRRTEFAARRTRSQVDQARLRRIGLLPQQSEMSACSAELRPSYAEYTQVVSSPGMAASLETSAFLLWLARKVQSRTPLDLGSGFSSYVLRHHAATASYDVHPVSVDDDNVWLRRTRDYLASQELHDGELVLLGDFEVTPSDLVFHDIAQGLRRHACMEIALHSSTGPILFDDMQHSGHRHSAVGASLTAGRQLFSLMSVTRDSIGRYSAITV